MWGRSARSYRKMDELAEPSRAFPRLGDAGRVRRVCPDVGWGHGASIDQMGPKLIDGGRWDPFIYRWDPIFFSVGGIRGGFVRVEVFGQMGEYWVCQISPMIMRSWGKCW